MFFFLNVNEVMTKYKNWNLSKRLTNVSEYWTNNPNFRFRYSTQTSFCINFYSVSLILSIHMTNPKTNGFLVLRRGRFWSWVGWGGLVYSVARKMIELLVKVGHNDRWGEWCWPHSELSRTAAKLRWSKGKLALGWIFS